MILLQGLIGLLRRSLGKVLTSLFGWAVFALFGSVRKKEKTLLSAVVAAVAVWPILLAGIAFPKVSAFILAFIPMPRWVSSEALRILWISLALLVPVAVGFVMQKRHGVQKWGIKTFLAGFPLTVGLSAAFVLAFFTLPFQKLIVAVRGEREEHVTLITEDNAQDEVAREIERALDADGLAVTPGKVPWLARALSGILRRTVAIVGTHTSGPLFFRGPDLQLTLYPHGATVRGLAKAVARAHAVIAGIATGTAALQTTDPSAQKLERKIKEAWQKAAAGRLGRSSGELYVEIARAVSALDCPYEDWEIVYRESLQLGLLLHGIDDPVAEGPEARFEPDPALRSRSRELARTSRGRGKEKKVPRSSSPFRRLAMKVAQRVFVPKRGH